MADENNSVNEKNRSADSEKRDVDTNAPDYKSPLLSTREISSISAALTPKKMKANKFDCDAKAGTLSKLYLVNFCLTCLTFGLYFFWGATHARRYMASSIMLNNRDRFEYVGTPLELLFGGLKVMAAILLLVAGMAFASATGYMSVYLVVLFFVYVFLFCGIYLAKRYRLNRTKWRGVGFSMHGNVLTYVKLSIVRLFINIFTLGYAIPVSDIKKWEYMANNIRYGKSRFKFRLIPRNLTLVNMTSLWVPLLFVIVLVIMLSPLLSEKKELIENVEIGSKELQARLAEVSTKILFLQILICATGFFGFLGRQWYYAAMRVERLRGLSLGKVRFKSTASGADFFKLRFTNLLLLIFTLGFGLAMTRIRSAQFECRTVVIGGNLDALAASPHGSDKKSEAGDILVTNAD